MDRKFLRQAIDLALEHSVNGDSGPFGAVVVCDGLVVGEGWNCVAAGNDPTAHAEIMAIRAAAQTLGRFDLSDCEMYSSCEPCPMCLGAIYWARIPCLMYGADQADAARAGFDDQEFYRQLSLSADQRSLEIVRDLQADAGKVFDRWLTNPGRIAY